MQYINEAENSYSDLGRGIGNVLQFVIAQKVRKEAEKAAKDKLKFDQDATLAGLALDREKAVLDNAKFATEREKFKQDTIAAEDQRKNAQLQRDIHAAALAKETEDRKLATAARLKAEHLSNFNAAEAVGNGMISVPFTPELAKQRNIPLPADPSGYPKEWTVPIDPALPYLKQPAQVRELMFEQARRSAPEGVKISPVEFAQMMAARDVAMNPPDLSKFPVTGVKEGPGGTEITRSGGAANIVQPLMTAAGEKIPGQFITAEGKQISAPRDPADNLKLKMEAAAADSVDDTNLAAIKRVREIIADTSINPVGPVAGSWLRQVGNRAAGALGLKANYTAQRELEQAVNKQILQAASQMKGQLSDRDVKFLQASVPKLTDDEALWTRFADMWETAVRKSQAARQAAMTGQANPAEVGLAEQFGLPQVALPSGVSAPGELPGFNSVEEANAAEAAGLIPEGVKQVRILNARTGQWEIANRKP